MLLLVWGLMTESAEARRKDGLIYRGKQWLIDCVDISGGYIFDHKYEKFTVTTAVNNVFGPRYGAFTMLELDRTAPSVVIGPTVSLTDFAYVWGGIDFISQRGMFARGGFKYARKDLGIGFYPVRWFTVKIAHSFNAGSRMEIGFRIPLEKDPAYLLRIRNRR